MDSIFALPLPHSPLRLSTPVLYFRYEIPPARRRAACGVNSRRQCRCAARRPGNRHRAQECKLPRLDEWLQLLTSIGIDRVQIHGAEAGDGPKIRNDGTPRQPSYHVVGVLTARDQLVLPGGRFARSDRARLKDYFDRLGADGAEAMTAPKGRYGLTEKELKAAFADLTQPVDFETKGQSARAVIDRFQKILGQKLVLDADADRLIGVASPVANDVKGLSAGTALAIVLRDCGLVMRPRSRAASR